MGKFFNMDNPVFAGLSRLTDLMFANLLFIICSLPIFTIGASLTALTTVTQKMKAGQDGYVLQTFFKAFRKDFKKSTILWLIMFALGLILGVDFLAIRQMSSRPMLILVIIGIFLWLMVMTWLFALHAKFENTVQQNLKNAVLLAIGKAPVSLVNAALVIAAAIISILNGFVMAWAMLFWLMAGFACMSMINSTLTEKTIKALTPETEDEGKAGDSWDVDSIDESAFDALKGENPKAE